MKEQEEFSHRKLCEETRGKKRQLKNMEIFLCI
jgi:hypothetical protein